MKCRTSRRHAECGDAVGRRSTARSRARNRDIPSAISALSSSRSSSSREGKKFAEAGVTRASNIEVKTVDGARVVAFTYETPTGQPEFYAKKEVLGLDLRRPYFRTAESFDNDGKIFESIVFQNIAPKTFDEATFNPKNPATIQLLGTRRKCV